MGSHAINRRAKSRAALPGDTFPAGGALLPTDRRFAPRLEQRFRVIVQDSRLDLHEGYTRNLGRHGALIALPVEADVAVGDSVLVLLQWTSRGRFESTPLTRDARVVRISSRLDDSVGMTNPQCMVDVAVEWRHPIDLSNQF